MVSSSATLRSDIESCRICSDRFLQTKTAHTPRPVFWLQKGAPILIAGQAPGQRVHLSGKPFDDRSGDRLRDWMGIDRPDFYDKSLIAVLPMAFCFPGYNASGSDLPPPPVCAKTWHKKVIDGFGMPSLVLLVGGYAQKWHLGTDAAPTVTATVKNWRAHAPQVFPLPHPSWRNTGWLRKNPWFEAELVPTLRGQVQTAFRRAKGKNP